MCMFCCCFWSNNCTQHSMTLACTLNKNNMFECVLKQQNAFRVWSRNLAKNVSSKHWEDTFFQKILEQLLFVTSIAPIWIGIQMTQLLQTMLFTSKLVKSDPKTIILQLLPRLSLTPRYSRYKWVCISDQTENLYGSIFQLTSRSAAAPWSPLFFLFNLDLMTTD